MCLEVINFAIWQGDTARFIAESATDGPERKTQIRAEMSKRWRPRPWEMVCVDARMCKVGGRGAKGHLAGIRGSGTF